MGSCKAWYVAVAAIVSAITMVEGLSTNYYSSSCPNVLPTVKAVVDAAVRNETRIGASLLRLHFHDCFVNGCDGSILLDDSSTFTGEKTATPNANSVRGFDVVDNMKAAVENVCPGVVSCADILAIAARDSVVALGGPYWQVLLGRRDSTTANFTAANTDIPPPTSNLTSLRSSFAKQGLSVKDLVALSGGHTIGYARCTSFRDRIYNDTNVDATFANEKQQICPRVGRNNKLSRLDRATPTYFDNCYYRNLLKKKGLLHSDQELTTGSSTYYYVNEYVSSPSTFFQDFANSMINMGNISPPNGNGGEIRINCRKAN